MAAMLSSGIGGVIYLGVVDDGRVTGLRLTQDQCDHVQMSVIDTLKRFQPSIDIKQLIKSQLDLPITMRFVPVVDDGDDDISVVVHRFNSR